jgi:hypothetical protein
MTMPTLAKLIKGLSMLAAVGAVQVCEADCRLPPISQSVVDAHGLGDYVQIQKSFSGSLQDSKAPAELAYERPQSGPSFAHIDFGIKTVAYQFLDCGRLHARVAPVGEYHRSSEQYNEVRKLSGGGIAQMDFALDQRAHNLVFLDLQYKYTRDQLQQQSTRTETATFAPYSIHPFAPGYQFRSGDKRVFRYMPSIGYERDQNVAIKYKSGSGTVLVAPPVNASFYTAALNAKLFLLPQSLNERLAITATQTWRRLIGTSDTLPRTGHLAETSIDYYFDDQQRFAVGFSYQNGRDPKRNFLDEQISSIGFKVQLGKSP